MIDRRVSLLSDDERTKTLDCIVGLQGSSGLIWRAQDDVGDPWNHVEAAMALAAGGRLAPARRAYQWLAEHQCSDGSWFASYDKDGGHGDYVDTNATAYVAGGLFHYLEASGDFAEIRRLFPVVEQAIDFVAAQQLASGAIAWAVSSDGQRAGDALLAASCSVLQSFSAAVALGSRLGVVRPGWEQAARYLRTAITTDLAEGVNFRPTAQYAMDWYYPILCGAVDGRVAVERLIAGTGRFVLSEGVRCRADRRWVTTAETAECALAWARLGAFDRAEQLMAAVAAARDEMGGYVTGKVYPEAIEFPSGERTSYSAAAVLLAADYLAGGEATTALFSLSPPAQSRVAS